MTTTTHDAVRDTSNPRRSAAPSPARRRLTHVDLDALHVSPLNVRKHGPKEIASLAQSIRAQGLLQPLIVRKDDTGFEVIGGSRRLKALQKNASEDASAHINAAPVPVILLGDDDDAAAIEASLAENIERLPMDELDQYTAFAALIRQGRTSEDIAESFGITVQTVRRRLALARLIPDIHRLYRAGDIDAETLKLLTLATKVRQRAYVALKRDPEAAPPPRWQLKAWLLGGAEIDTRHALFDEALYQGDITGDLFAEARYFADAEQFWRLQNTAIAALRDDLLAKGWPQVHVIGPEDRFQPHEWEDVSKAQGGHAVIEVRPNGEIEVSKGLLTRTEARAALKRAEKACKATPSPGDDDRIRDGDDEAASTDRPELPAPLANYCDLMRLSAVKAALLKSPKVALRLMLAHLLGTSVHISAKREPMQAMSEATAASLAARGSTTSVASAMTEARALLGLDADDPLLARGYEPERTGFLFAKLTTLTDAQVMKLLALVMAETLALGSGLVDSLGETLKVDVSADWQPDDAFFDLLRDREVTGAMLAEVIGARAAASYLTDTGKAKKQIIRNALAGHGRERVEGWCPRWMTFPQGQYTKRRRTAHKPPAA